MARAASHGTKVLERGDIYFMMRPKVGRDEIKGIEDIQRFYIILSPRKRKKVYRLITIGQKQMPGAHDGGKGWGFVSKIGHRAEEVEDELDKETYQTKTRGRRTREAAQPAGEGVYAIVRHEDHTHLAYTLELPHKPKEVQKELNIAEEGSYIITVKNPEKPSPPRAGLRGEQKAEFPERLKKAFEGRRFAVTDPPDFLDFEGAEVVLAGAEERPARSLGLRLDAERETEASAEIFRDLKLERGKHQLKPLIKGEWE